MVVLTLLFVNKYLFLVVLLMAMARARIIKNANRKEWEFSRQKFMFGASCAADVVGLGRSSRNQLLQRYVWKAFKQQARGGGLARYISKGEEKAVNQFLQRKMANGCANEARIMRVVQNHGLHMETIFGSGTDPSDVSTRFVMRKGLGNPGDRILEWSIVESPFNPLMACSPDGLFVEGGLGYEFKTKDQVRVPSRPEEVLDCEYLQCQTCLSFCRDFVWAWILCYNRLDTGEFKAYLVVLDEELWDTFMAPATDEFVTKCMGVAQELVETLSKGQQTGKGKAFLRYNDFLEDHKYPPFERGVKAHNNSLTTSSKQRHVFPIDFC